MVPRALPLAFCACALLALQLSAAAGSKGGDGGPVVRVQQGRLRGRRVDQPGAPLRTYYAFLGVPFARPPVGHLRFQDPLKPQPWRGVRNATTSGARCLQRDFDTNEVAGEEDCLFLDVYTADAPDLWATARRPVMVFLHGGSYIVGSGALNTTRPDTLLRRGVVLVTLNYRLGVMGFLNTEDSAAPGNAGLKDQVMALRWVQRNIAAFGGDPDNVTIFGFSSGGTSVQYLVLSPLAAGLFHKAAAMSGSALDSDGFIENPRHYAGALRMRFDDRCPHAAPDDIVLCLQSVDARDVADSFDQIAPPENGFRPAVEAPGSSPAPFLSADPLQLLQQGPFAKVPYLTGFVSAEGIFEAVVLGLLDNATAWARLDKIFVDTYRPAMPRGARTDEAVTRMRRFYVGNQSLAYALNDTHLMNRYVQMLSDLRITEGLVRAARALAGRGTRIFLYEFTHDGPFADFKRTYNATRLRGVSHGDDQNYLFEVPLQGSTTPPQAPPDEVAIRERQAELFANFVKTGNPTPHGSGLARWPLYTPEKERYMDMGANLTVRDHVLRERMAFWRQLEGDSPSTPSKN